MKRALIGLAILLVVATTSFAAGGQQTTQAATGDFVFGRDPVSFSWYVHNNVFVARDYGVDYKAEVYIKETYNVDIKMIDAGGAAEQKLTTFIVSNDFPDVMTLPRSQLARLVENGILVAFDDWLPDSYFLEAMGEGAINMLRSPDGKLYQYPDWMISGDEGNGNGGWIIQDAVHKALGSPRLETFDDLYAYLRQVRERFPDMIPLAVTQNFSGFRPIFAGFGEGMFQNSLSSLYAVPDGDRLVSVFEHPVFQEAALFTARLFREGLIDQDSFALNRDQDLERLPQAAVVASENIAMRGRETRTALKRTNPDNEWIPIWPIRKAGLDPNRIYPNSFNRLGGTVNVITRQARNPEAIFRYLDFAASPMANLITWYGPPGLYWTADQGFTPEGYPIDMRDSYFTAPAEEVRFAQGFGRIGNTTFIDGMARYFNQIDPSKTDWTKNAQINVAWRTSQDATEFTGIEPAAGTPMGIIHQEVQDIYTVTLSQIMFAGSDAEVRSVIARAAREANAAGMPQLLDSMTEAWQRNLDLLGN